MPDWLAFLLLIALWSLPLTLLHELGHGAAALAFTDGEVSIGLDRGGLRGGWASYEPARIRRPRDEAWIFAAGPAASLAAGIVLWISWLASGSGSIFTVLGTGTVVAAFQFLVSAVPVRYGRGFAHHGVSESDGRAAWRILTGGPPSADIEIRDPVDTTASTRPVFLVLLFLIGALAFWIDPVLGVELVGMFAAATVWVRVT